MFYYIEGDTLPKVRLADCTTIAPPYIHRKRKASEYILYLIKKGDMHLKENGKELKLLPGDVCILDPRYQHEGITSSWCEYYYIHFSNQKMVDIAEDEQLWNCLVENRQKALQSDIYSYEMCEQTKIYLPKQYHFENYSSLLKVYELLEEAKRQNEEKKEYYKILCACKVQEALAEISRCFTSTQILNQKETLPKFYPIVQEVLTLLNNEYKEKISSEFLEKRFNRNFDYMNRVFKQITGKTIFQYLTDVRINKAKMLLLSSALTIAEVGEKSGFPDEYYFSRVFKKITGESPTAYMKKSLTSNLLARPLSGTKAEEKDNTSE